MSGAIRGRRAPRGKPCGSITCRTSQHSRWRFRCWAGPGAITAVLLLAGKSAGQPLLLAVLLGVIAAVGLLCLAAFSLADRLSGALGVTGNLVLSRLLGIVLAALAVQYVVDGVRLAFPH